MLEVLRFRIPYNNISANYVSFATDTKLEFEIVGPSHVVSTTYNYSLILLYGGANKSFISSSIISTNLTRTPYE